MIPEVTLVQLCPYVRLYVGSQYSLPAKAAERMFHVWGSGFGGFRGSGQLGFGAFGFRVVGFGA